jgi:hypothetical protein
MRQRRLYATLMWKYVVIAVVVALLELWALDLVFVFDPQMPAPAGAH